MSRTDFTFDSGGVNQIGASAEVAEMMVAAGEKALAWAAAAAPRDTGEYSQSFEVEPAPVTVGGHTYAGAMLVNTSDHAIYVEYTNGDHVLARSVSIIESG